jgi:hypothetical protein
LQASGFEADFQGVGYTVTSQNPQPNTMASQGTKIQLTLGF